MNPKIAVVGIGAIGGYIGARMARAGADVTMIGMWPAHIEYLRAHGMQLFGRTEEERLSVPVRALHLCDVQSLAKERPIDIAFLAVKSYDTDWTTRLIAPYLDRHGVVVSLQNCINEERIASIVGWNRTMGVTMTRISVELYAPGHVKRMVPISGDKYTVFRVGEVHGRTTERALHIAELLRTTDSAKVTSNLWGERWSKLVTSAMRNGLSAASGAGGLERDTNPEIRRISVRLGAETIRVAQALGYQLELVQRMDTERIARAGEGDPEACAEIDRIIIENAATRPEEQRPSTAQDIAKGRRTEVDDINGYVAAKGASIGIPTPANIRINELVRRVERGELEPSVENLRGL